MYRIAQHLKKLYFDLGLGIFLGAKRSTLDMIDEKIKDIEFKLDLETILTIQKNETTSI